MNLHNEFQPIRDWAKEKGILDKGDIKTQTIKLVEEVGELAAAVLRRPETPHHAFAVSDAIGDIVVVLTSIAHFAGLRIEECINISYDEIKNRTGKMSDGNFIKSDDINAKP